MTKKKVISYILLFSFISVCIGIIIGKNFTIFYYKKEYSIGIYFGSNPFNMVSSDNVVNPVISYKNITDVNARFVADPFMVNEKNVWYMFFEVFNDDDNQGDIGLATSIDGIHWEYKKIVINEPFHLSYPYIFKMKGEYYLIPESARDYSIRLYKAIEFPYKWKLVGKLLKGNFKDTSVIFYNNMWYLFSDSSCNSDTLSLFYSKSLLGPWLEHPKSPIVLNNPHIARPGGRIKLINNNLYRFTQDDFPTYGRQVRVFKIKILSTIDYQEEEIPESPIIKASGGGWNADGMHNMDLHQIDEENWIACVDGLRKPIGFRISF